MVYYEFTIVKPNIDLDRFIAIFQRIKEWVLLGIVIVRMTTVEYLLCGNMQPQKQGKEDEQLLHVAKDKEEEGNVVVKMIW